MLLGDWCYLNEDGKRIHTYESRTQRMVCVSTQITKVCACTCACVCVERGRERDGRGRTHFYFSWVAIFGKFSFLPYTHFFFPWQQACLSSMFRKKKTYKYIQIKFFSKGFHQFLKETRLNFQLTPQSADIGSTLPPRTEGDGRCVCTGSGVTPVWPKAQC